MVTNSYSWAPEYSYDDEYEEEATDATTTTDSTDARRRRLHAKKYANRRERARRAAINEKVPAVKEHKAKFDRDFAEIHKKHGGKRGSKKWHNARRKLDESEVDWAAIKSSPFHYTDDNSGEVLLLEDSALSNENVF